MNNSHPVVKVMAFYKPVLIVIINRIGFMAVMIIVGQFIFDLMLNR
jgi:hypothetical protein